MEILLKTLNLTLVSSLILFVVSAGYLYRQQRKKVNALIALIHEYAKKAQENYVPGIRALEDTLAKIKKGDPYGEHNKDYTPLIFYSKQDELSFEQISDVMRHLKKKEQKLLLEYFIAQSTMDAFLREINTEYFRTIPQARKAFIIDLLIKATRKLKDTTDAFVAALDRRQ